MPVCVRQDDEGGTLRTSCCLPQLFPYWVWNDKDVSEKATRLAIGHCGCSDIECLSQYMVRFDLPQLDKEVFRDLCTRQNKRGSDE